MCVEKAADRILEYLAAYKDMLPSGYETLHQHNIKADRGEIISTGIVNNKFVSIARMHLTNQGITSPWHSHTEGETFILQRGNPYYIEIDGVKQCVKVQDGKSCYVPPGARHRLAGTEGDSWSIVVLVPGSNTFPAGAENGKQ